MFFTDRQIAEALDGLLGDEFLALSNGKMRCNMAKTIETKVQVSQVKEWIEEHSNDPGDLYWSERDSRESVVRMIALGKCPEWKKSDDLRIDYRGVDQEYHVVNETLRDEDLPRAESTPTPRVLPNDRLAKIRPALSTELDYGRMAAKVKAARAAAKAKVARMVAKTKVAFDPLGQIPDNSISDDTVWQRQMRTLENISSMTNHAMAYVRLSAEEFNEVMLELKAYINQNLIKPSKPD